MKSFRKLFALAALAAIFVPGVTNAATTSGLRFEAVAAAWMCSCCARSCGGNSLYGCYNTTSMPPNAVTCSYKKADGVEFDCMSCKVAATPATPEDEVFLQELSSGAGSH